MLWLGRVVAAAAYASLQPNVAQPPWRAPALHAPRATTPRADFALGVDVGTGSARAGLVDLKTGALVAVRKRDILMFHPRADYYEQSSDDVWDAICECVNGALADAGASPSSVVGLAFDATCSLVCVNSTGAPIGIDPDARDDTSRNIIVWLDHRAEEQAARINALGHERLKTVGGTISPEMQMPKLLWLREELPDAFAATDKFFDLSDYLSWRATDRAVDIRSLCTVVCKWNYDAPDVGGVGWDRSYIEQIGFGADELPPSSIGVTVSPPGAAIPGGLGAVAAAELGLEPGTPLAVGMIDAHAGGIGSLGADPPPAAAAVSPASLSTEYKLESRLALIAGTSTCHMASSIAPCFVPGVWGPYYSAMFAGTFLNEGGQSAAGALIDHLIDSHAARAELEAEAGGEPRTLALNRLLAQLAAEKNIAVPLLAAEVHVGPDFIGNRSPLADAAMRGSIVGLGLTAGLAELALLYLATTQALAYQTRHIVETIELAGHEPIRSIYACGGLSKNELYVQSHADALGRPIYLPTEEEAVLLGAAVLGAAASGAYGSVGEAAGVMTSIAAEIVPTEADDILAYHERKYAVFLQMTKDQQRYRQMMCAE